MHKNCLNVVTFLISIIRAKTAKIYTRFLTYTFWAQSSLFNNILCCYN